MEHLPLVDLQAQQAQQAEIADEVREEIDYILWSAGFIGGPAVDRFEAAYTQFTGTGHCVGVGNGTDAPELALRACGVRAGGEVILPPTLLWPWPRRWPGWVRCLCLSTLTPCTS